MRDEDRGGPADSEVEGGAARSDAAVASGPPPRSRPVSEAHAVGAVDEPALPPRSRPEPGAHAVGAVDEPGLPPKSRLVPRPHVPGAIAEPTPPPRSRPASRPNVIGAVDGRDWVAEQLAAARAAADPTPPPPPTVAEAFRDLAVGWADTLAAAWNSPHGRDVRLAARAGAHAVLAAVATWLVAVTLCLTVWLVSAPDTTGIDGPLRVAGQLWLLGHHAALDVPGGRIAMAPLGFTALLVFALWHTAAAPVAGPVHVAYTAFGAATGYGLAAALVAAGAETGDVHPDTAQAVLFAVLFALAVPTVSRWRRVAEFWGPGAPPRWIPTAVRAAAVAAAVLVAGGAATLAGSLIAHLPETGWPGGTADALGMFLLSLAVLPNAILWSASYVLGPGFAVGTGTGVSILSVKTGALPLFPLLGAVPHRGGHPSAYCLAFPAVPVLAGVAAALVATRARHRSLGDRVRALSAAAVGVALAAGLAATLSGGPLAGGRMAAFGPSGWSTAAATLVLVGVSAAAVVLLPPSALAVRRLSVRRLSVRRLLRPLSSVPVLVTDHRAAEVGPGLTAPDEDDRQQPDDQRQPGEHLVDRRDPAVAERAQAADGAEAEEDAGDDACVVVAAPAGQGHPEPQARPDQAEDDDRDHEERLVAVDGVLAEAVVLEGVGDVVDLGQADDDVDQGDPHAGEHQVDGGPH